MGETIEVIRNGAQPSAKGQEEYFTGNVRVDPLFQENEFAPYSAAYVTFEPGARTAWHTHPTGQRLIVTYGVGWVQERGGPIWEIRAGMSFGFRRASNIGMARRRRRR